MKKRNYNIDFLRGIATLWIIVIHTAFWSGEAYLPKWFSNITLFLDVPAFMYIAGVTFSFNKSLSKSIKGLINQWKKWCFFLIFYVLLMLFFFRTSFAYKDIISWLFYTFPKETPLIVVQGSLWFITMYFTVTLLCSIIILINNYFVKRKKDNITNLINIIILLLIIFGYSSTSKTTFILSTYTSFYSIIYILGYITSKYRLDTKQTITYCIINLIFLVGIFMVNDLTLLDIQNVKFPPSIPYLFVSMFSVIIFWYLKDKLNIKKNNIINYIGKNAIFYYFAQGISSSLINKILAIMPSMNCYLLFIIMLIINVIIATILAIVLEKTYSLICKIKLEKVKKFILPTKISKSKI